MKKLIIICFIFFTSQVFSAPGTLSRYEVKVELSNNFIYEGFIYPSVIMGTRKYDPEKEKFLDYFKETTANDSISIYSEIKHINKYNVDLACTKFKNTIKISDIKSIDLIEEYEYYSDLIHEIDTSLYLQLNPFNIISEEIYNNEYAEHCALILIAKASTTGLEKRKNDIEQRLKEVLSIKVDGPDLSHEINKYLTGLTKKLKRENIIVFTKCGVL
ncbi:hypothetical protein [Psychroserpens luteus]|uniref:DUF541 domain-containing protein n=1 Tax=Psychroserpens luteus TaxID=1434066 RepID=A0ABW5ZNQ5_9FLAO|nr:hypothetical protein [Psychroserpens luteus]